jgi:cytochrome c556
MKLLEIVVSHFKIGLLLDKAEKLEEEEREEMLKRISGEIERLERVIKGE